MSGLYMTPARGTYEWLKKSASVTPDGYLDNHTHAHIDKATGNIMVKLYDTDILQVLPSNVAVLQTGGFFTSLTRRRINELLPAGVAIKQVEGSWWLAANNGIFPYRNGMMVDCDTGRVVNQ